MNKEEAKKKYGENLRRIRQAKGMSQEELAKALGYTNRSSINKIEIGRSCIPSDKIARTAAVLGVSPLELFECEYEPVDTLPNGGYHGSEENVEVLIEFDKLNEINKAKVQAYCQALLDTQEDKK